MAHREKEGKREIRKSEYLEKNEKSFLGEIKSIFHNFLRAIIELKRKIADTSFKADK